MVRLRTITYRQIPSQSPHPQQIFRQDRTVWQIPGLGELFCCQNQKRLLWGDSNRLHDGMALARNALSAASQTPPLSEMALDVCKSAATAAAAFYCCSKLADLHGLPGLGSLRWLGAAMLGAYCGGVQGAAWARARQQDHHVRQLVGAFLSNTNGDTRALSAQELAEMSQRTGCQGRTVRLLARRLGLGAQPLKKSCRS